jgi:hypothetical protein
VWVGLLPRTGLDVAGLHTGVSTVIANDWDAVAHELGHFLGFNHVNPNESCGPKPDGHFDDYPNGGAIQRVDIFNINYGKVATGSQAPFDFMTYACKKWVSRQRWMDIFNKFCV